MGDERLLLSGFASIWQMLNGPFGRWIALAYRCESVCYNVYISNVFIGVRQWKKK
jgi:hypothetical protein